MIGLTIQTRPVIEPYHPETETARTKKLFNLQLGMGWLPEQPGGLNRYVHSLCSQLSLKQPLTLIAMADASAAVAPFNLMPIASRESSLLSRWSNLRRAFTVTLNHSRPAVVASHFALYSYPLRRHLNRIPHVIHFHGPWAAESAAEGANWMASSCKKYLEKSVYRTGDRFITLSQAFAQILIKQYGVAAENVRVIPGGADPDQFDLPLTREDARDQLGWPTDRPTIVCVRRLAHRMGLEPLVEAINQVRRLHRDVQLMIVGKGKLSERLAQLINSRGLTNHVRLIGYLSDEELPLAYRAADFSIVPSQCLEGFGLITVESLAAGTPVIVTPVGGLPEIVHDLSPNLITDSSASVAIAERINEVLAGKVSLPTASDCQKFMRSRFTWERVASEVWTVYEEAIKSSG
jgi:glycosyltransferase involved in cell wall biosynthesis